jgi:hypothetical protein
MKSLKTIAAGAAIAGALGFAAIGADTAVASAAPAPGAGHFAQDRWDHGHGPGWGGPGYWAPPPPPPPPYYGYGGYGPPPPPCLSGPLGFVQVCA